MNSFPNSSIDKLARKTVDFARETYNSKAVALHRPIFEGNEKNYLCQCIDSNFVSSAGSLISDFEDLFVEFTGIKHAIAVTNGTAALHLGLIAAGVRNDTEVITQPLTFVATCNAIRYAGASPIFCDVSLNTFGLSAKSLASFLNTHVEVIDGHARNVLSGRIISACLPMHTFGNPCEIAKIKNLCDEFCIPLVEDCAEALGSYINDEHAGNFGLVSAFSFNGNKIITTGGGGMVTTNEDALASKIRHLSTTAKVASGDYNFYHDVLGYNYRMPNINAALGCAQIEKIDHIINEKILIFQKWKKFFTEYELKMLEPLPGCISNNWLNAVILPSRKERDLFLKYTNDHGIMTRPVWHLMNKLPEFNECYTYCSENAEWIQERVVNLPSSARMT